MWAWRAAVVALVGVVALGAISGVMAQEALTASPLTTRTLVDGVPTQVHAKVGSTISISVETSSAVTITTSDVSFFGRGSQAVAPTSVTGSGTSWEVRLNVVNSHVEGPLRFWITAHDAVMPTSTITLTEADIAGHHVSIDRTRPEFTITPTSSTTTLVTLNEPLSPLVAASRELDVSRWCVNDSQTRQIMCSPDADYNRDVTSATVLSLGLSPVILLTHEPVVHLSDMVVVFDHHDTSTPFLFTDAALNLPAIPASQSGVDASMQRIFVSPPAASSDHVFPFTAEYDVGNRRILVRMGDAIGLTGNLTPANWRVEHGEPSPDVTTNDLLTRTITQSPPSETDLHVRYIGLVPAATVPENANLWVTYTPGGSPPLRVGTAGMILTGSAQFALNPDTRPTTLTVSAQRDSGSGPASYDGDLRASDTITVTMRLREATLSTSVPTISFFGEAAVDMTGTAGGRDWTATLAVRDDDASTDGVNEGTPEGSVEFDITATNVGLTAVRYDESHVTDGSSVSVDRTPPQVRTAKFVDSRSEIHVVPDEPVSHTSLTDLFTATSGGSEVELSDVTFDALRGAYVIEITAAAQGSTYVLTPTAGAITDGAGNALAGSFSVVDESAAPTVTSMSLDVLRADEAGMYVLRSGAHAEYAMADDVIRVTLGLNEITHPITVPTVRFFDQQTPVAMNGSPGDMAWTADFLVTSMTREGSVEFDIVALDYVGNAADIDETGVTDMSDAIVDLTAPLASPSMTFSYTATPTGFTLFFAEDLDDTTVMTSAFVLKSPEGGVVMQSAAPTYAASTPSAQAGVSFTTAALSDGDHTVEIATSLTDRAGNSYVADDVTVYVDTTAPTVTGIATESSTTTIVTLDEAVMADGNAAQRLRHWTVTDDDPDGSSGPIEAPVRAISNVEVIDTEGMAAASGERIRITHASLASTASTPTVAYTPVSTDVGGIGAVTLGLVTDASPPLATRLAAVPATEADDLASPTANDPSFTNARTITFTLSEPVVRTFLERTTVSPSLGTVTVSVDGLRVTLSGTTNAIDGTTYSIEVPSAVNDLRCVGMPDTCEPNMFSLDSVELVYGDTYAPTADSATFLSSSRIDVEVSETLDADTLSGITVSPPLGTLTVTQFDLTVVISFTGTPSAGTEYTVTIPTTVTDAATPPNAFALTTLTETYSADMTQPTLVSATQTSYGVFVLRFSEPITGTTTTGDWFVWDNRAPDLDPDAIRFPAIVNVALDGGFATSATSLTIPGTGALVREITLSVRVESTESRPIVQHVGSGLTDLSGNILRDTDRSNEHGSVRTIDEAPPESLGIVVESTRARQADLVPGIDIGTQLVKTGDTVTFTVEFDGSSSALRTVFPRTTLEVNPTIQYVRGGTTYPLAYHSDVENWSHTLAITGDMPDGLLVPFITIKDQAGNIGEYLGASTNPNACDRIADAIPANRATGCLQGVGLEQGLPRLFPTVDNSPPVIESAETTTTTTTLVTLDEPVLTSTGTPAQIADNWAMTSGTDTVNVSSAAVDGSEVTLTHDTLDTYATPTLTYTRGTTEDAGRIIDRVDNSLAQADSVPVADGTAPAFVSATIGASPSRTVTVIFSEDIARSSVSATTIMLEDSDGTAVGGTLLYHDPDNEDTVAITFPSSAVALDGMYTLRITTGITDASPQANPLPAEATASIALNTEAPYMVSATTRLPASSLLALSGYNTQPGPVSTVLHLYDGAQSRSVVPSPLSAITTVTLSEPVTTPGSATMENVRSHWKVAAGSTDLTVTSVAVSGRTVAITHSIPASTDSTFTVTHTVGDSAGLVMDSANANIADDENAQSSDGIIPLWSARLTGPTTALVTFSEPVMQVPGTTAIDAWRASGRGDLADQRMGEDRYSRANDGDRRLASATLSDDGRSMTLEMSAAIPTDDRAYSATNLPWIKYYPGAFARQSPVPATAIANTIVDLAGNALTDRVYQTGDGIAPVLTVASFDGTTMSVTSSRPLDSATIQGGNFVLRGPGSLTTTHTPTLVAGGTTSAFSLAFSPALTLSGSYTMVLGDVYDTVTTQHPGETRAGNRLVLSEPTVMFLPSGATNPVLASAETLTKTTTQVTFNQPVEGMTSRSQWTITSQGLTINVLGVAAGSATPVDSADPITVARSGATLTMTLLHDAISSGLTPGIDYDPAGDTSIADANRLRDNSNNAVLGTGTTGPTATDGIPPQVSDATFIARNGLRLTFEEPLAQASVTAMGTTFTITDPSGDPVSLASDNPVSYSASSQSVTLILEDFTTEHGDYGITIVGVTDTVSPTANSCTAMTCTTTADREVQLPVLGTTGSLVASVLSGDPLAAKSTNPNIATGGDTLRVALTLAGIVPDPAAPSVIDSALLRDIDIPTISFFGGAEVIMTDVTQAGSPAKSSWSIDYIVPSTPQRDAQAEFSITIGHNLDTATFTRAELTSGTAVSVDTKPPGLSASAADPLYTRTEAVGATAGLGSARNAQVGDVMLVVLTTDEPLSGVILGDATFSSGRAATDVSSDHTSRGITPALPEDTYVYSRTVASDEPEGPVEFSITVRDAVGNTDTLDADDLPTGDDATGYRLSVDRTAPTVSSAMFTSPTVLTITFGESGIQTLPATLTLTRTSTPGTTTSTLTATLSGEPDGASVTYTVPAIQPYAPESAEYTFTLPATILDDALNAYVPPADAIMVSESPVTISSAETSSTTVTDVTLSAPPAALGTDATPATPATPAQIASHWSVSEVIDGTTVTREVTGAAITDSTIRLTHAPLASSSSTPSVAYTAPASRAVGQLVDATSSTLSVQTFSGTAADGAPPVMTARFTTPAIITVTLDSPYVTTPAERAPALSNTMSPMDNAATFTLAQAPPTTLTLSLGGTVDDGTYEFTITVYDSNGNMGVQAFSLDRDSTSIFASARTLSHTSVEVSFALGTALAQGVTSLDPARWTVITPVEGAQGATTITVASVSALADNKVTLTLASPGMVASDGTPDTAATPTVKYTRGVGDAVEILGSTSEELMSDSKRATDAAPPTPHSAVTSSTANGERLVMAFSEPLYVGSVAAPGITDAEITSQLSIHVDGATEGTAPSSISRSSDGTELTLTYTGVSLNPVAASTFVRYDGTLPVGERILDVVPNTLSNAALDTLVTDMIVPSISSARTAGATTTEVTYDEPIALVGDPASLYAIEFPAGTTTSPGSVAIKTGDPSVAVLTHSSVTYGVDSTATLAYTAGTAVLSVTDAAAGANRAEAATEVRIADGIAPKITGVETESQTTTIVTLDGPVTAGGDAAQRSRHWTVTDVDPDGTGPVAAPDRAVSGVDTIDAAGAIATSGMSIRLTHAELSDTASTPTVAYVARVDSNADGTIDASDEPSRVIDPAVDVSSMPAPNILAGYTTTAIDKAPPVITARFATATSITLTLSEPIERTTALLTRSNWDIDSAGTGDNPRLLQTSTQTETAVSYPASTPLSMTIRLNDAASDNVHTLTIPAGIVDRADTPNAYVASRALTVDPIAGVAFTASATGQSTIEITFTTDVERIGSAPLATSAWIVYETPTQGTQAERIPISSVSALADNKVTLTLSPSPGRDAQTSTGKTPYVEYVRDTSEFRDVATRVPLAAEASAVATDDTDPTIKSARTSSTTQITVTLNEPVGFVGTGANAPSTAGQIAQWSACVPPEGSSSCTVAETLSSIGIAISGSTVTLNFAPADEWETDVVPVVTYRNIDEPEDSETPVADLSERARARLVDVNGNGMDAVSYQSADGVAPVIVSASTASVRSINVVLSEVSVFAPASSTSAQRGPHWTATVDGTSSAGSTAAISTVSGTSTLTFRVASEGAWTGDDSPTVAYVDPAGAGRVTDVHGNAMLVASGVMTTNVAAPELLSARTVSLGRTEVVVSKPAQINAGTAAQVIGHWSLLDIDGGDAGDAPDPVTIRGVRLDDSISHEPASSVVELSLSGSLPNGVHEITARNTIASTGGTTPSSDQTTRITSYVPPMVFEDLTLGDDRISLLFSHDVEESTILGSLVLPSTMTVRGDDPVSFQRLNNKLVHVDVTRTPDLVESVTIRDTIRSTEGHRPLGDQVISKSTTSQSLNDADVSPDGRSILLNFDAEISATTAVVAAFELPTGVSFAASSPVVTTAGSTLVTLNLSSQLPRGIHTISTKETPALVSTTSSVLYPGTHTITWDPEPHVLEHVSTSPDGRTITLHFSRSVDTSTLTPANIALSTGTALTQSQISHAVGPRVTITLDAPLATGTHSVTVRTGVTASGYPLPSETVRSFVHMPSAPSITSASLSDDGRTVTLVFSHALDSATVTPAALSYSEALEGVVGDRTRLIIDHDDLSGPGAAPTLSYDPDTSTSGTIALNGVSTSLVEETPSLAVADGIPPRLVGDPELVGWSFGKIFGPDSTEPPPRNLQDAVRFTFSEPMNRDDLIVTFDVGGAQVSAAPGQFAFYQGSSVMAPGNTFLNTHRGQIIFPLTYKTDAGIVRFAPLPEYRDESTWGQVIPGYNSFDLPRAALGAHLDTTNMIYTIYNQGGATTEGLGFVRFIDLANHPTVQLRDVAGNPYIPDQSRKHDEFILETDTVGPKFRAKVASPTQINVEYLEPVEIKQGRELRSADWRIDLTPDDDSDNEDGNPNWIGPTAVTHAFDEFPNPEFLSYGDLGTRSRLTVMLTVDPPTETVNAMSPLDATSLNVHYVASSADVADARSHDAVVPFAFEYRPGVTDNTGHDEIAPAAASLVTTVERPTATEGEFAERTGAFAHYAMAGDRITVSAVLDSPALAATADAGVDVGVLTPYLELGTYAVNMEQGTPPQYSVVIPTTVTDADGIAFAADTSHAVTYVASPPTLSNPSFGAPSRIFIETSEPLDDTTLTPTSVRVEGLETVRVDREIDRVVINTRHDAIPGKSYTIRIADTVTDTDGVATAATTLSVQYPVKATATARFANDNRLVITTSEWIVESNILDRYVSLSAVGGTSEPLDLESATFFFPHLGFNIDDDVPTGTYELTFSDSFVTSAGTTFESPILVEHVAGLRTPEGAPTASNVRFFGPEHIQFEMDQYPATSTLENIEVPTLGVKRVSRDALTITLALEGRADRVSWQASWIVPTADSTTLTQGPIDFTITATDAAGNAGDIGQSSVSTGTNNAIVDTTMPTFEAAIVASDRTSVTFVEPARGTIVASEWCVEGIASVGVSADGVEFAPSYAVVDAATVTEGQTFILRHTAVPHGTEPTVEYSPSEPCAPDAPSG